MTNRARLVSTLVGALFLSCVAPLHATLPKASPESVRMRGERLRRIDELAAEGIAAGNMPGCVVTVGRRGKIVFQRAYGHRQVMPSKVPMSVDTVFDMASITKPVATATSAMILVEQGKLRLRDRVSTYIDGFANSGKASMTVMQLLTHQAGFVPDNALADYEGGRKPAFEKIYQLKTDYSPGARFVYSDVGFILLDDLIERQSGLTVAAFAQEHIFTPLGMKESGYLPGPPLRARAAVTEQRDSKWLQGEVHDPRAHRMNGVAGHAGLFSTADDLSIYAQMMLNGGHYGGRRILSESGVELMTDTYPIVEGAKVSKRGLGWDKLSGYSSNRGENMSEQAFGHGGFTGTVLWIDPKFELFFVFLSNRLHPDGKGSVNRLAGRMATVAVAAIDEQSPDDLGRGDPIALPPVMTGIDRLQQQDFAPLRDQRVGLITNQTGINANGESTVSLFHQSSRVNLTALFSPEHGMEGRFDRAILEDAVDQASGLKIFSLYGKTRQPTAEQLESVDTLVFDIQDIGCRFYTYISTMGLAMEAAAREGKKFVVLDRPNPINGWQLGGPMLDSGQESFVGFHRLPVRHGMTVGELARLFREERGLHELELEVVTCSGWKRDMYFDETGLSWINPSPNMRNLNEAILYPGIGLWETTNLSVGRGTDCPFEIVGAPFIDERQLAAEMNRLGIPGVRFTPRSFTPASSKYEQQRCGGVQISITDRRRLDPIAIGFGFAHVMRKLYPNDWRIDASMRLLGNQQTLAHLKQGHVGYEVMDAIQPSLEAFLVRRQPYLLY